MKFRRLFYDNRVDIKKITTEKVVIGIVLGLLSAFVIYSFFYVIRESFRLMILGFNDYGFHSFFNDEFILPKENRNFYNLFFSGLSLILGNSVAVLFIFSGPNNILNRFDSRRKRVLNDQVFLSFNFLYWITKVGLAVGVFAIAGLKLEYLPYFKPIAYLFLFVLYLETWKNLSLVIKKRRLIIQSGHLLILLVLSLGLSKIDVVNYKALDKASVKNNPIIDFPKSSFYDKNDAPWYTRNRTMGFKLKRNEAGNLDIYTESREKIGLGDIEYYVIAEKHAFREELIPFLSVNILADKDLNLGLIKTFEAKLYRAGIHMVNYEIRNEELYAKEFRNGLIKKRLYAPVLEFDGEFERTDSLESILLPPLPLHPPEPYFDKFDTVEVSIGKQPRFEDKPMRLSAIQKKFSKNINTKTVYLYKITKGATYQDYINMLTVHNTAVSELRKQEQTISSDQDCFDESCYKAYRNEQIRLRRKYPVYVIVSKEP
ncbi:hypothetical protein [Seonamhaeicola marinus]|uniref:Uncharacterized protein n=1 Tax=Seonamhaeicola marinus TaxID=1912246 RepID=A0A5D0HKG8_9FLAO|nr:hypothetical protein [Seonamhaeicola marinus]TYA69802.1 hypothetical protein FUA24_21135 [Seonamhaeicola marinus]